MKKNEKMNSRPLFTCSIINSLIVIRNQVVKRQGKKASTWKETNAHLKHKFYEFAFQEKQFLIIVANTRNKHAFGNFI